MPHFGMIFTLLSTIIASNLAKMTQLPGEFPIKAHDLSGGITKSGAFQVKLDTAHHTLHILFKKAGGGALMANSGTVAAGLEAGLVLLW